MEHINVSLDAFEGPLDLLLHLIEKNKIDIYDIPIARLTDQYMAYIEGFSAGDMEQLSEFLVMAATLLEIKSKMLLPEPPKEDEAEADPREELVNRLVEYRRFRMVTHEFEGRSVWAERFVTRPPERALLDAMKARLTVSLDDLLEGLTVGGLHAIYKDAMKRKALKTDVVREGFGSIVKDAHTVDEKMEHVLALLRAKGSIEFLELFDGDAPKAEVVVTFLAVLELIRLKRIDVRQDRVFDSIEITRAGITAVEGWPVK